MNLILFLTRYKWRLLGGVVILAHLYNLLQLDDYKSSVDYKSPVRKKDDDACRQERIKRFQGRDLLNNQDLWELVKDSRREMEDRLRIDYGRDYYEKIFYESGTNISRGRTAFYTSSRSWDQLKQRLQIKILTMQQKLISQEGKNNPICNINHTTKHPYYFTRWVYAAAGHSSAAGHGNFERDSYSAVLSRAMQPIFSSIGIEFESRNYGMTAMPSGPELALCMNSVYGIDVDLLSWDFGQTERPNESWKLPFWMFHAGVHPNRPALMAFNINQKKDEQILALEQQAFLSISAMNTSVMEQVLKGIPDMMGLREEQMNSMGPMLQYLKCQDMIEFGDPFCRDKKFEVEMCPKRRWKVRWHPGFKRLALSGNLLALFLVEVLQDAVHALQQTKVLNKEVSLQNIESELAKLRQAQDEAHLAFHSSDWIPETPPFNFTQWSDVDPTWLLKGVSLCRTARLPSQIRYKGILTGRTQWDMFFREGTERQAIMSTPLNSSNDALRLSYDERNRQASCNSSVNIDYMDFFYIINKKKRDDWFRTTLPSDAEASEYGSRVYNGLIVVCPYLCQRYGKEGGCLGDEILMKKWWMVVEFQVNGLSATSVEDFASQCVILRHERGHVFPSNNSNSTLGKYEIKMRINPEKAAYYETNETVYNLIQISSIILI